MSTFEAFAKTLPVLLLILLGVLLRARHFFNDQTAAGIKKLIVGLTLPLLLFRAFATMQFELRYLAIVAAVFFLCVLVMLAARVLGKGIHPRFYTIMAGYEAGMMGYAVYGALYGLENIARFAIFDLGQVLFVFFVLVNALEPDPSRRPGPAGLLLGFVRTPVILGILSGILLNFTGLYAALQGNPAGAALAETVTLIGGLTTPLVAIILGYDLRFQPGGLARPLLSSLIRLGVWAGLGVLLNHLLISGLFGLDRSYQAALMIMYVLPAPFVVPLYMPNASQADQDYVLNTISISTVLCLAAAVVVRLVYPA